MKYKIKQCWDCQCISLCRLGDIVQCKWCHLNMNEKKVNKILSSYGHSTIVSAKQDLNARRELENIGFRFK